jgi:hypothetical protein
MGPEVYFWYAGTQAAICVWSLWLWRTKSAPGAAELVVIAACLTYDNAVLATGHLLGRITQRLNSDAIDRRSSSYGI